MTRQELVAAIREKARVLYEGKQVPHRSCGMAIAETFDREPRPYHALRRGGITGVGHCGAIVAGQLVLGELFGYPDSTAPTSIALKEAIPDPVRSDRAGAILALVGVINVPIIYFSVQWWNTLHQGASVSLTRAPSMAKTMLLGMLLMALAAWMYSIATALARVRRGDGIPAPE